MELFENSAWEGVQRRSSRVTGLRNFIEHARKNPHKIVYEVLQKFRVALIEAGVDLEEIGSSENELQLIESYVKPKV